MNDLVPAALPVIPRKPADGAAGGRRAAAMLAIATCAEVSHATMEEDGAKVDVKLSFRHPHHKGAALTVHCQVKSGRSYGEPDTVNGWLRLKNITRETVSALREGTQPALLVWVPPAPSTSIYWHIIRRRPAGKGAIRLPRSRRVTPALRFDLAMAASHAAGMQALQVFNVPGDPPPAEGLDRVIEKALRQSAKLAYSRLRAQSLQNPLVGTLTASRVGWRRVTRRSKGARRRALSLLSVAYLGRVLAQMPTRYLVCPIPVAPTDTTNGTHARTRRTVDEREIVLWYERVFRIGGRPFTLLVRIRESISYPTTWTRYPLGVADVKRTAVLASWWCTESK